MSIIGAYGAQVDPILGTLGIVGRIEKPAFKYLSQYGVVISASASAPVYLRIGSELITVTEDIECNLLATGPGGLVSGSLAASTIYYLYVILEGGIPKAIADVNPPTEGPTGYPIRTYIGAFPTIATAVLPQFISIGGRLALSYDRIELVTYTGSTNWTAKTILMPTTAMVAIGMIVASGANANNAVHAAGSVTGSVNYPYGARVQVANIENYSYAEIPMETAGTIYLWTQNAGNTAGWRNVGWIEDPSEYL